MHFFVTQSLDEKIRSVFNTQESECKITRIVTYFIAGQARAGLRLTCKFNTIETSH